MLLDGEQGEVCYSDICEKGKSREEGKPFALPEKNTEMRRAFTYLTTTRGISRTVLAEFIKRRMIYEDRKYHNAVFVGYDKSGVARHAHKHGIILPWLSAAAEVVQRQFERQSEQQSKS